MKHRFLARVVAVAVLMPMIAVNGEGVAETPDALSPDAALRRLMAGNLRFAEDRPMHPHQSAERRRELLEGQHPFAVIVSCSDSRVPPELVFDAGLGDLFVIRLAGPVLNDHALGSIEYAVVHLGVTLVVVMGHESCGAVTAAVTDADASGHIGALIGSIQPSLRAAAVDGELTIERAVLAHTEAVRKELERTDPFIASRVRDGRLRVVSAYDRLSDGRVLFDVGRLLEPAPEQE